jgi:hypothetical protein
VITAAEWIRLILCADQHRRPVIEFADARLSGAPADTFQRRQGIHGVRFARKVEDDAAAAHEHTVLATRFRAIRGAAGAGECVVGVEWLALIEYGGDEHLQPVGLEVPAAADPVSMHVRRDGIEPADAARKLRIIEVAGVPDAGNAHFAATIDRDQFMRIVDDDGDRSLSANRQIAEVGRFHAPFRASAFDALRRPCLVQVGGRTSLGCACTCTGSA